MKVPRVKKIELFGLLIIVIIFYKLKIFLTTKGYFPFTFDQGRDLFVAAKMVFEKDFVLIGPTTGIQGIFYGPWWYYFLAPLAIVSGGNPQVFGNFFVLWGALTVICIYFFIRYITGSGLIAFVLAFLSCVTTWMLAPTFIWSPALVPIFLMVFLVSAKKIYENAHAGYFFLLGFCTQMITNGEVPFGLMLTIWVFLSLVIFRKTFFKPKFVYTLIGMALVILPQVLFEFRNNFLVTHSVLSYVNEPKIFGEEFPIAVRFIQRIDQYFGLFSTVFSNGNKTLAILVALFMMFALVILRKNKKEWSDLKENFLFRYSLYLFIFSIFFFTLFKDRVWDYYLIGIPLILLTLTAYILSFTLKIQNMKKTILLFCFIIIAISFPKSMLAPFNSNISGDGGDYKNAKDVMDYISSQNPNNYSIYSFSPAIIDHPFDYLIYWYTRNGKLEKPSPDKEQFYLIIREVSTEKYLTSGWYGDKTRDKSRILEKKEFGGDIVLEKHIR
jgi:hypothetical protein